MFVPSHFLTQPFRFCERLVCAVQFNLCHYQSFIVSIEFIYFKYFSGGRCTSGDLWPPSACPGRANIPLGG